MFCKNFVFLLFVVNVVLCIRINQHNEPQGPLADESKTYHNYHGNNGAAHRSAYSVQDTDKGRDEHSSNHRFSNGEHGKQGKTSDRKDYEEDTGHIEKHHDQANNYNNHEQSGKTLKAAKFGEKEGHKRGHKTSGYHNKFFKDEYHREHKFYDNYHKKGHFKKNGDYSNRFKSNEGANKKGGFSRSGIQRDERGKKGHYDRGHYEDETKGNKFRQGNEQHRNTNEDYGRSRSSGGGNRYGYRQTH